MLLGAAAVLLASAAAFLGAAEDFLGSEEDFLGSAANFLGSEEERRGSELCLLACEGWGLAPSPAWRGPSDRGFVDPQRIEALPFLAGLSGYPSRVRRVSRTAVVVWSVMLLGGCAAISGLDQIQETECAPNCEAGTADAVADHTVDSPVGDDSQPGTDATQDTSTDDSSQQPEASSDDSGGSDGATGMDAQTQDASDASTGGGDSSFTDAPFDGSGCGDLNTTTNCGGCGLACTKTHANSAQCCTGSTCPGSTNGVGDSCQYACQNGYLDCNGSIPPDSDGCECQAPGATQAQCCGTGCPDSHTTGLVGQSYYPPTPTFYDCIPAGTMNQQLGLDACGAYVTARGGVPATNCALFGPTDGGLADSVCAVASCNGGVCTGFMNDCICWTFSGMYKGGVLDPQVAGLMASQCWQGTSTSTFN